MARCYYVHEDKFLKISESLVKLTVEDVVPREESRFAWQRRRAATSPFDASIPPINTLFWRAISEWAPKIRVLHWHEDDRMFWASGFRVVHLANRFCGNRRNGLKFIK